MVWTISKRESDGLKGVAILLMFVHHLFGLPHLIAPDNAYVSAIPGVPLDYWLGRYGKICVAMFLFLSGYGFAIQGHDRWSYYGSKVYRFFQIYWFYFLVFVPIGVLFFQHVLLSGAPRYTPSAERLITNFFALRSNYNAEWWFAEVYVALVLLAPLVLASLRRWRALLVASAILFALGAVADVAGINPPLLTVSNILIWQVPFVAGALAAHWRDVLPSLTARGPVWLIALTAALVSAFFAVEAVVPRAMAPFLILTTPLWMALTLAAYRAASTTHAVLEPLGRYAMPLWLVHTFYCYYFAQGIVYAPRYGPLILLNLTAMTFATVWALERIRVPLWRAVDRLVAPAPATK